MTKFKLSLMLKFFLTTLAVGVTIALVITVVSTQFNMAASRNQAQGSLATISDNSVMLVSEWLMQKEKLVQVIASTKRIIDFTMDRNPESFNIVSDYLKQLSNIYGEFQNIIIVDIKTGLIINDAKNGMAIGKDIKNYNAWDQRNVDKPFIDTIITKSITDGSFVFTMSAPIKNDRGQITGLALLSIDWFKFASKSFDNTKIGESGYIYMIDKTGQVIYHPKDRSIILDGKTPDNFRMVAVEKKDYFQRNLYKGTWKYLDSSHIPETGWIVCATVNENELLKGSLIAVWVSTLFAALILAISAVLSFIISMGISKPITKIISSLSDSSAQIAVSSNQLSESSQEIANGATEQASSIEETTASMEELSSMVRQNVDNSKEASILAEKSSNASEIGFEQMEKMLESMNDINKSSDEIKTVIDVIDDIAFQTNMLALNAAVEAARAGEAGMGFAVVADEVKNLANRSAESAKETAKMVKEIMIKIESGLDISRKMADVFKEILVNSKKVSEMSKEVESASRQQDTGISQVNKAIIQFDAVVQSNAGSSEETASAAEELLSQVETLNDVVKDLFFIVTGKEYIIKEQNRSRKITRKTSYTSAVKKKPKLLSEPKRLVRSEKIEMDEDTPKQQHKISFEDDDEFNNMDDM